VLTGGQVADCTAAGALLDRLPDCDVLHADKGYAAAAIRRQVEEKRGTMPNIPLKVIANGSPASRHSSTEPETRSSGCFAG
jgi:hypothetical protein